jgi:BirA family transcriptional regulator, biotin operon repressor / biotin---[acetyl-CoA-carboxylase] ligase
MDFNILRFETLDSTNTEAAKQARQGAAEGVCVVAKEQTAGKGRQGRAWTSTKGAGVYMSLILRPRLDPAHLSLITLAAAVAVYEVLLKGFLIRPDIKWPNDILVDGKKICGILAEAVETPAGLAVILGLGINLDPPSDNNATGIRGETSFRTTRDEVLGAVLNEFKTTHELLQRSPASIIELWSERSSYATGSTVRITLSDGTVHGVTDGLEPSGALRVKLSDGSTTVVHAGDVERLRSTA